MKKLLQAVIFGSFFANAALAAPKVPKELKADSLVYCTNIAGFSFNPQKADMGTQLNVVTAQIYDKLFEFDSKNHQLRPALAESFQISDDGFTITLKLRKKVAFHTTKWFTPTRYFNAEDVVFSLHRVMGDLSDLTSHIEEVDFTRKLADKAHFPFFDSIDLKSKIVEITAVNDHEVKIRLTEPEGREILRHLTSHYAVMLSKEYALQLTADENLAMLDILPVGTGVYQLDNFASHDFARLKPHAQYWGEPAHIQNMIVDFSTSGTGRMAKFLNGECDVSAFPEPSQLAVLKPEQGYVVENSGANLIYLALNFEPNNKKLLMSVADRKQIIQSIDRERLAKILFYGTANVADNVLPKALFDEPNPHSYPYQVADNQFKAQLNLWVIDEKRVYHISPRKLAEYIRADLEKNGFKINVRQVNRANLIEHLSQAKREDTYDLILGGWLANNSDPDSILRPLLSCEAKDDETNLSNWCHPEFDRLLEEMNHASDLRTRHEWLQKIQALLEQELPLIPLVNVSPSLVVKHHVDGVAINPFGQVKLSQFRLKPRESDKDKTEGK